jgi:hypothetical protein
MEVKDSDGKHVGAVLRVESGRLKIPSSGMDHDVDFEMVDAINDQTVHLRTTAEDIVRTWH